MTVREFSYWWGSQNPSPVGVRINWKNYMLGLGISAEEYYKEWLFSGVLFNYATPQPRHGVLPWFTDMAYEYPAGWSNHNWKVAMYIPCHPDPKVGSPHEPHFTQKVIDSYKGVINGPYGSGKSKKLFQWGHNNNMPVANEGTNTTPQQLYDAFIALRAALTAAGASAAMSWIGPNIVLQYEHFTGVDAWRNGSAYMDAFDALWAADPNFVPSIFGFTILADTPTDYQTRFNKVVDYMDQWPTKNFRIMEAACGAPDSATQIATMNKALDLMGATPQCKGVYWKWATNEFNYSSAPWPLAIATGYQPNGHFPWPFAVNAVGAHFINQWNGRYTPIPNPSNAPPTGVQPYPMSNPA